MPLIVTDLQSGLKDLFADNSNKDKTKADAANEFYEVFQSYAKKGLAGAFPLKAPGPAASTFPSLLTVAFNAGLAPAVAQAISAGVVAYWSAALFEFTPAPGIAAPPIAAPALIGAATGTLLNTQNTADLCALQLATAIDLCCRSVLVTFINPPPAPPLVLPVV